jgi:hypothetical protein
MWQNISNIAKTAAAFLQEGAVPPNTPKELEAQLGAANHLSSKKFFLAFSGFIILGIFFAVCVVILFMMAATPSLLGTYAVLFSKTIEVFAVIMAVYLGSQALVDLRYNSSSSASVDTSIQDITEKRIANEKEEDYSLD